MGEEWYSPYPGPTGSEQVSQEIQIQYVHTCIPVASSTAGGLVHHYQSERRVFPHHNLSPLQKVSKIRLPRDMLQVQHALFWLVSNTHCVRTVHGSSDNSAEATGHLPGHLSGQLAVVSTIGAGSQGALSNSHMTPFSLEFCDKHKKEQAVSSSQSYLSWIISGLQLTELASQQRVRSFRASLMFFWLCRPVLIRLYLQLFGLMAIPFLRSG